MGRNRNGRNKQIIILIISIWKKDFLIREDFSSLFYYIKLYTIKIEKIYIENELQEEYNS